MSGLLMSYGPMPADDPLWWLPEDLQLLKGSSLASAVAQYQAGLQSLLTWRDRLEQLCR